MLAEAIRRYFLRSYAAELARPQRRGLFNPYDEAKFQTSLLVLQPLVGIGASLLYLLLQTDLREALIAHRSAVMVVAAFAMLAIAHLVVKHLAQPYRDAPQAAAAFGSKRDRWITNLHST